MTETPTPVVDGYPANAPTGQITPPVEIPLCVNGTLEWVNGDLAPRRRSWVNHPGCGCRGEM